MFDRSSGHIGLSFLIFVFGLYVLASYGYAVAVAPTMTDSAPSLIWLVALLLFIVLTGVLGVIAGITLWNRSVNGRRYGFAFVLAWILLEALAIWGWFAGPPIAPAVVRDPMAPAVRLWIALSTGLYLWGWADAYVDRPNRANIDA